MSRAELLIMAVVVLGLLVCHGCGKGQTTGRPSNAVAPSSSSADTGGTAASGTGLPRDVGEGAVITDLKTSAADGLSGQVVDGVREIKLTASMCKFDPNKLVVRQNEKVRIIATSTDVTHGFGLRDFNINQKIEPGKETVIEFTPNRTGSFEFHCMVYCGSRHDDMKGTLTVKP